MNVRLNKTEQAILDTLKTTPKLTNRDLSVATGYPAASIRRTALAMERRNLLVEVGNAAEHQLTWNVREQASV